jgi:crossover junction endodeoxyribonuclease RusA
VGRVDRTYFQASPPERKVQEMKITIPGVPPSVNSYVRHSRGRHYKTSAATKFQSDIAILAAGRVVNADEYWVTIEVTLGPKQRGDVDNFPKVCLDGLVKAGVIRTDAAIVELIVRKCRGAQGSTEIWVQGI